MPEKRHLTTYDGGALSGLRGTVIGRGPVGLMTAFALAQNGASIQVLAAAPLEQGVGFRVAAGLIEPVATRDARAARWIAETLEFLGWAAVDPAWGATPRRVLFLSDDSDAVRQPWMSTMGRRDATDHELRGGRAHGAWFETFVIQPDLATSAVKRECENLDIQGGAKDLMLVGPQSVVSVEDAATRALAQRSDFFVLAPGLGLAGLSDIESLTGMPMAAGLSAGLGAVIRIPAESFTPPLDHVLMDDEEFGYLIPQLTHVVAGGVNDIAEHDDPAVTGVVDPSLIDAWEDEIREKVERLRPGAGSLDGEIRVGARPMRSEVLTHWTEGFAVPGLILGGTGGSGWTFSVGIAHGACQVVAEHFGLKAGLRALGTGKPLERRPDDDMPMAA